MRTTTINTHRLAIHGDMRVCAWFIALPFKPDATLSPIEAAADGFYLLALLVGRDDFVARERPEHRVQLLLHPLHHFGVLTQQQQSPRQSGGGGLVSRQQEPNGET